MVPNVGRIHKERLVGPRIPQRIHLLLSPLARLLP